jgi:hypothetical protein
MTPGQQAEFSRSDEQMEWLHGFGKSNDPILATPELFEDWRNTCAAWAGLVHPFRVDRACPPLTDARLPAIRHAGE